MSRATFVPGPKLSEDHEFAHVESAVAWRAKLICPNNGFDSVIALGHIALPPLPTVTPTPMAEDSSAAETVAGACLVQSKTSGEPQ